MSIENVNLFCRGETGTYTTIATAKKYKTLEHDGVYKQICREVRGLHIRSLLVYIFMWISVILVLLDKVTSQ